jgi:hypothetical protein
VRWRALLAAVALVLAGGSAARAHEARPGFLELRETGAETYSFLWKKPTGGEIEIQIAPRVEETGWEFALSGALYVLPDEDDFVQPTFKIDRGLFHFETRYNYEDRESTSFFVGANFEFGDKLKLSLTPMIGGLVGQTDGIIPALEADLTLGPFEAYAEAEYVFDLDDSDSSYFYMWSELSLWPTEWLRAGVVTQRTRVFQTERDIQRGLLVGFALKKVDGTVYFFNPGADDYFTVVSLGVSF